SAASYWRTASASLAAASSSSAAARLGRPSPRARAANARKRAALAASALNPVFKYSWARGSRDTEALLSPALVRSVVRAASARSRHSSEAGRVTPSGLGTGRTRARISPHGPTHGPPDGPPDGPPHGQCP